MCTTTITFEPFLRTEGRAPRGYVFEHQTTLSRSSHPGKSSKLTVRDGKKVPMLEWPRWPCMHLLRQTCQRVESGDNCKVTLEVGSRLVASRYFPF